MDYGAKYDNRSFDIVLCSLCGTEKCSGKDLTIVMLHAWASDWSAMGKTLWQLNDGCWVQTAGWNILTLSNGNSHFIAIFRWVQTSPVLVQWFMK